MHYVLIPAPSRAPSAYMTIEKTGNGTAIAIVLPEEIFHSEMSSDILTNRSKWEFHRETKFLILIDLSKCRSSFPRGKLSEGGATTSECQKFRSEQLF